MSELSTLLPILWGGFCTTLAIFGLTLLFSIPLGLLIAVLKMSKWRVVRYPVSFYISVMRGTPLLLQIVAIYFGSYYLSEYAGVDFSFDRFPAVIVAFSINYAAYFAEIFRGGIQSIPKGQYEAAYMHAGEGHFPCAGDCGDGTFCAGQETAGRLCEHLPAVRGGRILLCGEPFAERAFRLRGTQAQLL